MESKRDNGACSYSLGNYLPAMNIAEQICKANQNQVTENGMTERNVMTVKRILSNPKGYDKF